MSTDDYMKWVDTHRDDLNLTLPVSEVFGPTIQGEGPHAGRACYFIRLGGCNLSCTWCDTPYSTGQHGIPLSTVPRITVNTITAGIPRNTIVVLTGGEPTMHLGRPAFTALLHMLKAKGCQVHIETNGMTIPGTEYTHLIDHITVSPKLNVPMVNPRHTPTLPNWSTWTGQKCIKRVWDHGDADTFVQDTITLAHDRGFHHTDIWVMPEGTTSTQLAPRWAPLAQAAANHNINATHRLHTLAWEDKKGH